LCRRFVDGGLEKWDEHREAGRTGSPAALRPHGEQRRLAGPELPEEEGDGRGIILDPCFQGGEGRRRRLGALDGDVRGLEVIVDIDELASTAGGKVDEDVIAEAIDEGRDTPAAVL
jgi:hypothetical protein